MFTEPLHNRHSPYVQGPTGVRRAIVDYMKWAIPEAITYANEEWTERRFLAAPQQYLEYEPTGISHRTGPILGVGVTGTRASRAVDFSDIVESELLTSYGVNLYLWCYTPETSNETVPDDARQSALRMRDDMSTLIRSMLYAAPGMFDPAVYSINVGTIREDFSDSTPVGNASGRHIAAVAISFELDVEERMHRVELGYVSLPGYPDPGVNVQTDQLDKE